MKRLGLLALAALLLAAAGGGEAQKPARMNETGWTAMGSAPNLTVSGLATPGAITVTPTLSQVGSITTVAAGWRATGLLTAAEGSVYVDGETFVLNDGTNIPQSFEFDPLNDGVTGGRVAVVLDGTETAVEVAALCTTAINATTSPTFTLEAIDNLDGTVTLRNTTWAASGNAPQSETVADGAFVLTAMSGGVDAGIVDGDYVTVKYDGGVIPIEFDAGDGTSGGRIPLVFEGTETADDIRDALIAVINAAAPAALTATSGGAATVALELDTPGAVGDTNTENVADAGFAVTGFADPTAATTYTYKLVARQADGTTTEAGAASTTNAGHATLSAKNYNALAWTAVPGAVSYDVYRTAGGATQGKVVASSSLLAASDAGLTGGGETPPSADSTGLLTTDNFKMPTGASAGLVLVSDDDGRGTWGAAGSGSGDITSVAVTATGPLTGTASCATGACSFTLGLNTLGFTEFRLPGSTTLPATCTLRDVYVDEDATPGQGLYVCTATDTWTRVGGGITNGAGANVIPKSDGTNLVASALSESSAGVFATSAGTALSFAATAPAATTGASQAGAAVSLAASAATASTDTAGAATGGAVTITAGAAARLTSGNAVGGGISLVTGAGIGTGGYGSVSIPNGQLIVPDGTASAPSIGFSGATSWGIFRDSGIGVRVGIAGSGAWGIGQTKIVGANTGEIGWVSGSTLGTTTDTSLRRKAAANPAWGAAAASPVAYTHTLAADGSGTDIRGAKASLTPGIGTGAGGSGDLALQTATAGSTGTTANGAVDRVYLYSLAKTLTDGSATALFDVALPSGSHVGVTVDATIIAENASDYQTRRVSMNLSAHNKGGTVTSSTPTEYGASALLDSGTLTTAWTVTNGTGKITVNLNADSDLGTQTRLVVRYQIRVDGDAGTVVSTS